MTRRLGRRSGAVVALLTVLLVTVPASPAAAAAVITIDAPAAGTSTSPAVNVEGRAESDTPLLYRIKTVKLVIADKSRDVECTQQPCRFSWAVNLPVNGPYVLKVTAAEATVLGNLLGSTKEASRSFSVAAPPARPVLDKPTVTEGRTVDLSWSRNTEPDMLYYALFRRDPGSSSFIRIGGNIAQKPSAKITFSDTTTSAFNGGDYAYQVVAVRKGASGTADTEAKSEPSGAAAVSVPPPPTTTTAAPNPAGVPAGTGTGAGTGGAGTTTTVKRGSAGGVDLSGFLNSRPPAVPLTPITTPEPPDTGFGANLPFGARPPGQELEEGEAEAVPPRGRTSVINSLENGRPLVPVAGGLVLLLLALHMRLLNRRIKAADAADLPVEGGASARAEPAPEPAPAPQTETARAQPEPEAAKEEWAPEEWAPPGARRPGIEPDLEPAAAAAPFFDFDADLDFELEAAAGHGRAGDRPDPDAIEVFEVVSPAPRRLARAGSR